MQVKIEIFGYKTGIRIDSSIDNKQALQASQIKLESKRLFVINFFT